MSNETNEAAKQSVTDRNHLGNAAKMRDALNETQSVIAKCMEILNKIPGGVPYDGLIDDVADELGDLRDSHVKSAISAPTRNCDVGTVEEQLDRYGLFCQNKCPTCENRFSCHICGERYRMKCMVAWSQMPYKEGGAK